MICKCKQCGEKFELTDKQIDHYKKSGVDIPVFCRDCRRAERMHYDAIVPRGRVRRKNRKNILKAVPPTFLALLIFLSFAYISFVRSGSGEGGRSGADSQYATAPANVQEAILFRSEKLLMEHYEKHGKEMGYGSAEEYLAGANATINHSYVLHKVEKEDGDDVYYVESTNDLVIVSTDGYIRTYFRPDDGREYYERQ